MIVLVPFLWATPRWSTRTTCAGNAEEGGCGAFLLVEQADVFWTSYTPGGTMFHAFCCPFCSVFTLLPHLEAWLDGGAFVPMHRAYRTAKEGAKERVGEARVTGQER